MDRRSSIKKMFSAVIGGIAAMILPKKAVACNTLHLQVLRLEPLYCRVTFELNELDKCLNLLKTLVPLVYGEGSLKYYTMSRKSDHISDHIVVEWEHKHKEV